MKKFFLFSTFLLLTRLSANAQIEVAKFTGKNSSEYKMGFGAFLKFAYPVSEAADISLEGGALFFQEKEITSYGVAFVPIKIGYRYTIDGSGTGFYAEPQVGYNAYGVKSYQNEDGANVDEKFHGVILSMGAGYLFPSAGGIQFDLGLRYESVLYKGNSVNCIALRLSHNFSFKKRDSD
jgi:hypothetical protein